MKKMLNWMAKIYQDMVWLVYEKVGLGGMIPSPLPPKKSIKLPC